MGTEFGAGLSTDVLGRLAVVSGVSGEHELPLGEGRSNL